ncbi:DUF6622 family protein [Undibacterium sp. CCC3.4]|uniref:DUF6622 family protein n=1 Tax=Undibacterium sp. CCC3.4 TaxID=3048609 RepID=UPI002AC9D21F|nr:DUF6622 family protein [Undibacterium sp. CCC3.4]MEB0138962.1 hypothetical protein [Undibacterium sp. CCC2.1]MEB0171707.1 hypothetical protein [Undibacterium sp. CCC1.1]MEB0214909.1 hypothetical protein [Undibacterium sp. 5I2]MEB0175593.1 hypothetical protein [Undibacterium sp. CCC3.4]WPX44894.1 hypothetical protein RHM61_06630 [Undibacterium sp. CCC3.4]
MLQQILIHTPIWVWALLAFLISRGFQASQDREVSVRKAVIMPLLMGALSLQGLIGHFGVQWASLGSWAAAVALAILVLLPLQTAGALRKLSGQLIWIRGSWIPMALMLSIFILKYAENIAVAVQPALRDDSGFVIVCSAVFGIMNGVFFTRLLAILAW